MRWRAGCENASPPRGRNWRGAPLPEKFRADRSPSCAGLRHYSEPEAMTKGKSHTGGVVTGLCPVLAGRSPATTRAIRALDVDHRYEFLHGCYALVEGCFLIRSEFDLDDLLDPLSSEFYRHADE